MRTLLSLPTHIFDEDGSPYSDAEVRVFEAGTTTAVTLYSAETGGSVLNPPQSGSLGNLPSIYYDNSNDLKIEIWANASTSPTNPLWSVDGLYAGTNNTTGFVTPEMFGGNTQVSFLAMVAFCKKYGLKMKSSGTIYFDSQVIFSGIGYYDFEGPFDLDFTAVDDATYMLGIFGSKFGETQALTAETGLSNRRDIQVSDTSAFAQGDNVMIISDAPFSNDSTSMTSEFGVIQSSPTSNTIELSEDLKSTYPSVTSRILKAPFDAVVKMKDVTITCALNNKAQIGFLFENCEILNYSCVGAHNTQSVAHKMTYCKLGTIDFAHGDLTYSRDTPDSFGYVLNVNGTWLGTVTDTNGYGWRHIITTSGSGSVPVDTNGNYNFTTLRGPLNISGTFGGGGYAAPLDQHENCTDVNFGDAKASMSPDALEGEDGIVLQGSHSSCGNTVIYGQTPRHAILMQSLGHNDDRANVMTLGNITARSSAADSYVLLIDNTQDRDDANTTVNTSTLRGKMAGGLYVNASVDTQDITVNIEALVTRRKEREIVRTAGANGYMKIDVKKIVAKSREGVSEEPSIYLAAGKNKQELVEGVMVDTHPTLELGTGYILDRPSSVI